MTPPWSNAHQETSTSDRVKRLKEESFERENEWSNELALITYRIECLNKLTMVLQVRFCHVFIFRSY